MSGRPINIQPAQANQLVQALKHEIELAKAAGAGTDESKQHYAKAESIKKILLNYQAQQKAAKEQQEAARLAQQGNNNNSMPMGGNGGGNNNGNNSAGGVGTPMSGNSASPGSRSFTPTMRQASPTGGQPQSAGSQQQNPNSGGGNLGTPALPASAITIENFNQVKARLQDFEKKIQGLTAEKTSSYLNPEQLTQIESQLSELRSKYTRYQKFAFYMKSELLKQQQQQQSGNGPSGSPAGSAASSHSNVQSRLAPGLVPQQHQHQQMQQQQHPQSQQQPQLHQQQQQPHQQQQQQVQRGSGIIPSLAPSNLPVSGNNGGGPIMSGAVNAGGPTSTANTTGTPAPGAAGVAATNASIESKTSKSPSPDKLSLQGITKQSVPLMPISSSINVKAPNPITLKPNGAMRPTLTGGYSTSMGQVLSQPATKLPNYEIANNALMPDGNRILLKRKLSELINTIGADEGDGKTVVDGDVEELMLDLADEFITSVTGFACRLAKHRKVDSIDVKDVQLHLEKNWNIRIPGYAIDEIKSVKRLGPSTSYLQKVQGVEIAKSVNDING